MHGCKLMFFLVFSIVTNVCFKYFIGMLYIFCNGYTRVFLVFQTYVASVLVVFGRMLQVLHLDVAKIDLVLHML
jgi:hypothetical protein